MTYLFSCYICQEKHPADFSHDHHKIPRESGLSNEELEAPSNKILLCPGCHVVMHLLAYMLNNPSRAGEANDWLSIHYKSFRDPSGCASRCLELAFLVVKYKVLKADGVIDEDALSDKPLMITLPMKYKNLLKLAAKDYKLGMIKYVQLLLLDTLRRKFPQFSDELTEYTQSL